MRKTLAGLALLVVAGLIIFLLWNSNLSPVDKKNSSEKIFLIKPGSGVSSIASDLKREGLIKNPLFFRLYVTKTGIDKKIQAGDFRLSPSMSSREIAKELTIGALDVWITIPGGKRSEEVATILQEKFSEYDSSWVDKLKPNEGYLFPETYLIPRDASIDQIISLLRNTFQEKYNTLNANNTGLTEQEIVILASMIEREARHKEDLPLVSSVMHNRLALNMPLQIDATIQYARGQSNTGKWWDPVFIEEYQSVKSDYNTYLHPGLPPGPIASPGLNALRAAVNPADTDYLYYITDQNGTNRYAKTYEEHQANIERYGL